MNKRLLLQTLLVMLFSCAWAQGPNDTKTYYQNADGKTGEALRTAMFNIINSGKNDISYDGLLEAYHTTDKRADGYLRDWYSNTTNYVIGGDKENASYKKEGDGYNREHTVPQSWFDKKAPMVSDLVHVVPTDGYVNNRRSNYPFGEVNNITYQSNGGYCKLGSCKTAGYSGTVFEPNDEIKGDIARIYFYMATCYKDKIGNWSGGIFTSDGLIGWTYDMLIRWSQADPVDEVEIARNNAVQTTAVTKKNGQKVKQGNRNPFVDYPGLEDYIWGDKKDVAFSYDNYNSGEQNYVARPVITPDAGTYYESVEVTISCATEGASIYYTLNGEDASEQSTLYTEPFTINELGTYTVKAVAIIDGNRSAQAEATYTITEQGGQGGGGDDTPVDCELALNDAFFGTSFGGVINNYDDDMVGTQDGVTVIYSKGTGSNRYCNDNHIRLYQGNTLTVKVGQGTLKEVEFVNKNSDKQLEASTGTVDGYTWTGDAAEVVFNVNSGSKNLQVASLKIKVNVPENPSGIDVAKTNSRLDGQRVIYDLSGRRVTNPTRGIYIVDGRKVVIR
jgi:endonuclease I